MVPPSVSPPPRTSLGDRLRLLALHLLREDGPLVRVDAFTRNLAGILWALAPIAPRSAALATRRARLALHDALHDALRARYARRHPVQAVSNQAVHARLSLGDHLSLLLTDAVGTLWCAVFFAGIGVGSIYGYVTNNALLGLVCGAVSSYFLQLVLLPIIMKGQNLQSQAAELRTEADHELALATAAAIASLQVQVATLVRGLSAQDTPPPAIVRMFGTPIRSSPASASPADTQPAPKSRRNPPPQKGN